MRAVRQALYHATDRELLSNVITHGFGPAADSWFSPEDPILRDVESAIRAGVAGTPAAFVGGRFFQGDPEAAL